MRKIFTFLTVLLIWGCSNYHWVALDRGTSIEIKIEHKRGYSEEEYVLRRALSKAMSEVGIRVESSKASRQLELRWVEKGEGLGAKGRHKTGVIALEGETWIKVEAILRDERGDMLTRAFFSQDSIYEMGIVPINSERWKQLSKNQSMERLSAEIALWLTGELE